MTDYYVLQDERTDKYLGFEVVSKKWFLTNMFHKAKIGSVLEDQTTGRSFADIPELESLLKSASSIWDRDMRKCSLKPKYVRLALI